MLLQDLKVYEIDLLFLTETDIVLDSETDFKIKDFNTYFPTRENKSDQIRIIALLRKSLEDTIKVKNVFMSKEFPSIWFEMSEIIKAHTFIAGFYRQWSWKGIKYSGTQLIKNSCISLL